MKKILSVTLIAICLFVGVKSVSAVSEADLKTKLTQTITVNGEKYSVANDIKVLAERYLNQYEVSDKDCKYISDKIDEAIKIIQAAKTVKASEMSKSTKNQLKALVADVSSNTSVKATVTKNALVIYDKDNKVFAEVTELVKQTGSETNTIAIVASVAALITVVGAYLVVRKVKSN